MQNSILKIQHPGIFFRDNYSRKLNMSDGEIARKLGVSREWYSKFVNAKSKEMSETMALKLAKATDTAPLDWIIMMANWRLANIIEKDPAREIERGCLLK